MPFFSLNIPDVLFLEYDGLSNLTVEKMLKTIETLAVTGHITSPVEELDKEEPPSAPWNNAKRPDHDGWYQVHDVLPPNGQKVFCEIMFQDKLHKGVGQYLDEAFCMHGEKYHISLSGRWRFATEDEWKAETVRGYEEYFGKAIDEQPTPHQEA